MYAELTLCALTGLLMYLSTTMRLKNSKLKGGEELKKGGEANLKEIRFERKFYDVTDWVKRHPGGRVIEFYVNNEEDASIAIQQFHHRSMKKIRAIFGSFKSRPIPEEKVVGVKEMKYKELTEDFYELYKEFQEEGLFEPSQIYTGIRIAECIFLGWFGMSLVISGCGWFQTLVGLFVLNVFQMRSQFLVHEGGHHSLTGIPNVDRLIENISFGVVTGLSGSYWRSQHNRHHAMPQRVHYDVDLNTLPVVAYNSTIWKIGKYKHNIFLKYQAKIFAPWTATLGRITWQLQSHPQYSLTSKNYEEFLYYALHYYGVYLLGLKPYLILIVLNSTSMLLTFSMSHSHTPVTEEPRHWIEYSTLHTINANPSWWCDYWTGYLNYQIDHHLFPTLPQFRLRGISGRVRALVEKHGLPYTCVSYAEAMRKVFQNLADVSQELEQEMKLKGDKPFWVAQGVL